MSFSEKLLKKDCPIKIRTKGFSMFPFIREGDSVLISPLQDREIAVGDIIAHSNNGKISITCHRLIKKKGSLLITKGDTSIQRYEKIPLVSVLGKVLIIERNNCKVNLQSNLHKFISPKIAWVSLYLPLVLLAIAYITKALITPQCLPGMSKKLISKIGQYNRNSVGTCAVNQ